MSDRPISRALPCQSFVVGSSVRRRDSNMCDRQEELKVLIKSESCLLAHEQLAACMVEHNRSWSKCQTFVKALKHCHDKQTPAAPTVPDGGPSGDVIIK